MEAALASNPLALGSLLVCNDGSAESCYAIAYGACLVKPTNELIVLTLYYDRPEQHQHSYDTIEYKELVASLHAQAVEKTQKAIEILDSLAVRVRYTTVTRGCSDIGKEIVEFASSKGVSRLR
ncbi:MAG: hypothetical protein K2X00_22810, partial [Nitrospiraceae bacterium]|nr:hypothetical protein [Nitrospiraceae bacterium]